MDKNEKKEGEENQKEQENRENESENGEETTEDDINETDIDLFMDNDESVDKLDDETHANWDEAGFDSDDIEIHNDSEDDDEVDDDIDTNTLLKILMQVHKIKSRKDEKEKNAFLPSVKKFLNASISKKSKLYSNSLVKKLIF